MTRPKDDDDPLMDDLLRDAFGFNDPEPDDDVIEDAERLALLQALERCGRLAPLDDSDDE